MQAKLLASSGQLRRDEQRPYWPLRFTIEDATTRATLPGGEAAAGTLAVIEIQLTGLGLCSLWPQVISIEPGTKPPRYKLNDTLYTHLAAQDCQILYSVSKIVCPVDVLLEIHCNAHHSFTGECLDSYVLYTCLDRRQVVPVLISVHLVQLFFSSYHARFCCRG